MVRFAFPELRQFSSYDCGASCLQGVLIYYGIDVSESDLVKIAKTNGRIGTTPSGLKRVVKKFRLKFKEGEMDADKLKKFIRKKIPIIVLIQAWKKNVHNWKKEWHSGHFVVSVGFDKDRMYFDDPYCPFRTYLSFEELEERWKDLMKINGKEKKLIKYGIAIYGKKPKFKENKMFHMDYDSFEKNSFVKDS